MKIKGILKIIVLFIILFSLNTSMVFANDINEFTDIGQYADSDIKIGQDEYTNPNQFDNYSNSGVYATNGPITRILLWVLACLRAFAVGLAIVMIIETGLKYIMTRSPEAKKMLRMQFPGVIIGIILLFGGSAILKLVSNLLEDFLAVV